MRVGRERDGEEGMSDSDEIANCDRIPPEEAGEQREDAAV